MRVDHLRRAMRMLGIDLRRDEHRGVAERARVEDRRDLADDPLVEQALNAAITSSSATPRQRRDVRVRPRRDREAALHQVQQPRGRRRRAAIAAPSRRLRSLGVRRAGSALRSRIGSPSALLGQPSRGVLRVVGDDRVGAGAAQRGEDLEHGRALVEMTGRGGRLDHRVLAADVVGGDRQPRLALDRRDHVAVGERRLDHHHVGALLHVEQRLAQRLARRSPGPSGRSGGRRTPASSRPRRGTGP